MPEDVATNGASWTQKEMLARVDAKLDTLTTAVSAKHAHYDVELALLKARADQSETRDDAVLAELVSAKRTMATEVANLKNGQLSATRVVKYGAATVGGLVILGDAIARFIK